jgi:hypothetical protein
MKKIYTVCLVCLCSVLTASAAILTVTEFDFNTVGNDGVSRMNWSPGPTINASNGNELDGLQVRAAVSGPETVLTMTLAKIADVKLFYRGPNITLPAEATGWDKLTIRMRQIGTDMVTPVAFNKAGTIANVTAAGAVLPTMGFPDSSGTVSGVPITVTKEAAGEWVVFSFDLTGLTGAFLTNWRIDPIQAPAVGPKSGNFEIDYIKITAVGK